MASFFVAADPLVHVAFNRDATHLIAATSSGIRVSSCSPFEHVFSRSGFASPDGSGVAGEVTSADVVPSESLVALVFGDTIRYWSEPHGQMMSADMSPSTHGVVRAIRHVGDHVLVAGDYTTTLHQISRDRVKQIMEVYTGPNPLGACALAQVDGGQAYVLACPSPARGEVQVWHKGRSVRRVAVRAHNSEVACLELSSDGQLLATADSLGLTVRIFSTTDGLTRQELRISCATTVIYCMVFSHDSKWLAVSSDKAAVDMFMVRVDLTPWTPPAPPSDAHNANTNLSPLAALMLAHSIATWPLAKFCLDRGIRYRVAFGQEPNTIFVIGMDGGFYRCQIDQVNGKMKQIEHRNVMDMM